MLKSCLLVALHISFERKSMNTTSRWGGYGASFFTIVCFGEGLAIALTQGDLPAWFAILTGACFSLATLSGVVCLVAALVGHFRTKRASTSPMGGEVRPGVI
jgi:hypothetical protein